MVECGSGEVRDVQAIIAHYLDACTSESVKLALEQKKRELELLTQPLNSDVQNLLDILGAFFDYKALAMVDYEAMLTAIDRKDLIIKNRIGL